MAQDAKEAPAEHQPPRVGASAAAVRELMDWSNITSLASLFVGGAAIITALVAIVTMVVTRNNVTRQLETQYKTHTEMLQHQRVLETDKDRRSLRDAKLARLREHYRVVLQSAELMSSLLRQERDISGISAPAYRAERLAEAQQQWGMLSAVFHE